MASECAGRRLANRERMRHERINQSRRAAGDKSVSSSPGVAEMETTQARILSEARTAFAELGYAPTTYRILADRTGVTAAAIYYYYSSKVELYEAVLEDTLRVAYDEWVLPGSSADRTTFERLAALLDVASDMNYSDWTLQAFMDTARVDSERHHNLARFRTRLHARRDEVFSDMVVAAVGAGEIEPSESLELLAFLNALAIGLGAMCRDPDAHRAATIAAKRVLIAYVERRPSDGAP